MWIIKSYQTHCFKTILLSGEVIDIAWLVGDMSTLYFIRFEKNLNIPNDPLFIDFERSCTLTNQGKLWDVFQLTDVIGLLVSSVGTKIDFSRGWHLENAFAIQSCLEL